MHTALVHSMLPPPKYKKKKKCQFRSKKMLVDSYELLSSGGFLQILQIHHSKHQQALCKTNVAGEVFYRCANKLIKHSPLHMNF